ncbi:hypothetical protein [Methanimicrococcus hacksteinii]|uniref:hypothetical protein n=1 Tax=Methanimicrococcus hacksteinii TaxID=3028293 RepID=UPI00298F0503|nr:hypothetical protein [Methanimicrococcus sp. At1]
MDSLPLHLLHAPYLSSHSYHIRSLRERGHRLPSVFCLHCCLQFCKYSCRLAGLSAAGIVTAACCLLPAACCLPAARRSREPHKF